MKKRLLMILLVPALAFTACTDEDDDDNTGSTGTTVNYIDQDLQGTIDGSSWTYMKGGVVTVQSYQYDDDFENIVDSGYQHSFTIMPDVDEDSCGFQTGEEPKLIFSFSNREDILTPGKHPLKFSFDAFSGDINQYESDIRTVTFTYDLAQNDIATEGEYEILTVDTDNKIVTGRMDVRFENTHSVNGNFTLKYCNF